MEKQTDPMMMYPSQRPTGPPLWSDPAVPRKRLEEGGRKKE
jgi:hypothetical protein